MAGNSTKANQTEADAAKAILQVGVEILGVGIVSFAAGSNDELGKVIVWIMLGLWMIWLINNPSIGNTIGKFLGNQTPGQGATALGQAAKNVGNIK